MLDCFTHTGSFGLNCKKAGAARVVSPWTSPTPPCAQPAANAAHNGLAVEYQAANVFDLLPTLTPGQFDYIILDPPAFTKSGKTVDSAQPGVQGDQLPGHEGPAPGRVPGHLLLLPLYDGRPVPEDAPRPPPATPRSSSAWWRPGPRAPDHPVLWTVPETDYLKFYIFQVV